MNNLFLVPRYRFISSQFNARYYDLVNVVSLTVSWYFQSCFSSCVSLLVQIFLCTSSKTNHKSKHLRSNNAEPLAMHLPFWPTVHGWVLSVPVIDATESMRNITSNCLCSVWYSLMVRQKNLPLIRWTAFL